MRILFSLTYYTPYISGLTLYVKRLAEALSKKGYQCVVISNRYHKDLSRGETINGVRVVRAKPLFKISKGYISSDWLIKNFREVKKTDVVVVNLPQFEGIVPAILGRIFGKKVVSIYHCEVILPSGLGNRVVNFFLNLSNFFSLFLSNKIVTYTEDFARNSKIITPFLGKVDYIYPPIDVPKIDVRVQKVIKKKIGGQYDYLIGVAARLSAEKGIEYLLEGIPAINDTMQQFSNVTMEGNNFKIAIVGPMEPVGEEKYKRRIMSLVEKYKDFVVFLGEVKPEDMGSFYSQIDILVLPSINSTEAFGMVQVEAMLMGVPVVATDLPGVRVPIQRTGMGKIVPIMNSQTLAEAIVEVLLNKKKYLKDKKLIEKEFGMEKTIEFYERLIRVV